MHKICFLDQNLATLMTIPILVAIVVAFLVMVATHRMNQLTVSLSALIIMTPHSVINDVLLTDVSSTSISVFPDGTDYIQKARDLISDDGWDFAAIVDSAKTFKDKISLLNVTSHQPELRWSNKGKQPSWTLNYTVLSFLLNGQNIPVLLA